MNFRNILILPVIIFTALSCSPKTWQVTEAVSTRIAIDSTTEVTADKHYEAWLQPIKQKIDAQMNVVIGQASETMKGHKPESLLSNFNADVYRETASSFIGEPVDMSVVNMGGLRTIVPAGNITIGKMFELMPFENELVILWIRGDKLMGLLQYFARAGGEGESGVRMTIRNRTAEDITIGGKPIELTKLYSIATNDYLAGGNDNMIQLGQYEKRSITGLKIRSVLIDYIKNETKKGNKIESKLDGRITISR